MKKLGSFLIIAVLMSGCAAARQRAKDRAAKKAGQDAGAFTPGVDVAEASIRGEEFGADPELQPVYFDYDSSSLRGAALEAVKKNAGWLKKHRDQEVLVAGHCDERGTVEYNLALGQKRAKEVREYYIRLGVPGKSIATISYGEEVQVCAEASEDCWGKNRRAETKIRARLANGAGKRKEK